MSSEWELDDGIKSIKSAWRREHTARANLEKMLEQAEAENAKLREDNDRLIQAVEDLHDVKLEDKLVQLENENDKLRELIKAAWRCTNTVPSCLECRIVAGGCTLLMAMRELGVEVE